MQLSSETPKKKKPPPLGVDKHCDKVEWETPLEILAPTRLIFGGSIPCDPCTSPRNHTQADVFYTAADDGFKQPWSRKGNFVNPPFGNAIVAWMLFVGEMAALGYPIAALYPCGSRFCTKYYQKGVLIPQATTMTIVDHRVRFELNGTPVKTQNPWDSILYTYNIDPALVAAHYGALGPVFELNLLHKPPPRTRKRKAS